MNPKKLSLSTRGEESAPVFFLTNFEIYAGPTDRGEWGGESRRGCYPITGSERLNAKQVRRRIFHCREKKK